MPLLVRLFILRRDKFKTLQIYGFFGMCKKKAEKIYHALTFGIFTPIGKYQSIKSSRPLYMEV